MGIQLFQRMLAQWLWKHDFTETMQALGLTPDVNSREQVLLWSQLVTLSSTLVTLADRDDDLLLKLQELLSKEFQSNEFSGWLGTLRTELLQGPVLVDPKELKS